MAYIPKFSDKRIQSRLLKAIMFCKKNLRVDKPKSLGTRWISNPENLGSESHKLGKYLRDNLLICIDFRYNKDLGLTKKYLLNEAGFKFLESQLIVPTVKSQLSTANNLSPTISAIADRFKRELDSGLVYKDSSFRLWHWMQYYPRADKAEVLKSAGFIHTYDIVCAAPTLLLQHSQSIPEILDYSVMIKPPGQRPRPKWIQGPMDLYLHTLNDYIKNRKAIRSRLASESGVDEGTIKGIINGLFQGGILSAHPTTGSYKELNGDIAVIKFLQQDPYIIELKKDIAVVWEYITPTMRRTTIKTKSGGKRLLRVSGKQKTALYRSLERKVLDSVCVYLQQTDNKCFLEHDGWSTEKPIDLVELKQHVLSETGFSVQIDYSSL